MVKLPMSLILVKLKKKRRAKQTTVCKRRTKPLKPRKKCCGGRGLKLAGTGKKPIFY